MFYFGASATTGIIAIGSRRHSNGDIVGFTAKADAKRAIYDFCRRHPTAEVVLVQSVHAMYPDAHLFSLRYDAVREQT